MLTLFMLTSIAKTVINAMYLLLKYHQLLSKTGYILRVVVRDSIEVVGSMANIPKHSKVSLHPTWLRTLGDRSPINEHVIYKHKDDTFHLSDDRRNSKVPIQNENFQWSIFTTASNTTITGMLCSFSFVR